MTGVHHSPFGAVFVHELLEIEQALQIPEGFFVLHPLQIIGQSKHGFHIGQCHMGWKNLLPNADYVNLYLTFVEDLLMMRLANRELSSTGLTHFVKEMGTCFQPDNEVHLFMTRFSSQFQVAELPSSTSGRLSQEFLDLPKGCKWMLIARVASWLIVLEE